MTLPRSADVRDDEEDPPRLSVGRTVPGARVRLVCFPFSGGGPMSFATWQRLLGGQVEVWGVTMPGRTGRSQERPPADWPVLVDRLATEIESRVTAPFALFGHSLGGLVAYETARALTSRGSAPVHLFASSAPAPHLHVAPPVPEDDSALLDFVDTRYASIPEEVRHQPELLAACLDMLRPDLRLGASYRFREGRCPALPVTAVHGVDDRTVTARQAAGWAEHTTGPCEVLSVPGGHFWFKDPEAHAWLLRLVGARLESAPAHTVGAGR